MIASGIPDVWRSVGFPMRGDTGFIDEVGEVDEEGEPDDIEDSPEYIVC
jgi:hypothetical protein